MLVPALSGSVQSHLRLKQQLRLATVTGNGEKNHMFDYRSRWHVSILPYGLSYKLLYIAWYTQHNMTSRMCGINTLTRVREVCAFC